MLITIKLQKLYYNYLDNEYNLENGIVKIELEQGASVRDVLKLLNIPEEAVKILLVNSRPYKLRQILKDKDHIFIFPPIAGG